MIYKIFLLLTGLGFLMLHQRLISRRRIRLQVNNDAHPIPQVGLPLNLNVEDWPKRLEVASYAMSVQDLAELPEETWPRLKSYLQNRHASLNLQITATEQVLKNIPKLLYKFEQYHIPISKAEVHPIAASEQETQLDILLNDCLSQLKRQYPAFKIGISGSFRNPQNNYEKNWNQWVQAQFSNIDGFVFGINIPDKMLANEALIEPFYYENQLQNQIQRSLRPQQQVHLHYFPTNLEALTWIQCLGMAHYFLMAFQQARVSQVFLQGYEKADTKSPETILKKLLVSAVQGKNYGQSVYYPSNNLPSQTVAQGTFPLILTWALVRDWEMNLILINFSDQEQLTQMAGLFTQQFFYEQLYVPRQYETKAPLQTEDMRCKVGQSVGGLRLAPYSITRVSASEFIPSLESLAIFETHRFSLEIASDKKQIKVHYRVLSTSRVSIRVYNIQGEKKFGLENQRQRGGDYEVHLDTTKLHPGLYKVQLIIHKIQASLTIEIND